ncbi:MAG: DUF1679 domain-containing protein [Caldilineaceae bacterium]|nr:DUF1679 domain-containing protein [Caldilineaceae bacterium]
MPDIELLTPYITPPETVTPAWLTEVLRASNMLKQGAVHAVDIESIDTSNSLTIRLRVSYSPDATSGLPTELILKQNLQADWAKEAGQEEVVFYQRIGALHPPPPAIPPCFAAASDAASGNSYLLLLDLSSTHKPPVKHPAQAGSVQSMPSPLAINQVIEALARHHAFWWDHPELASGAFQVGYWSRDAERAALYFQRRQAGWQALIAEEADWFPSELIQLYTKAFDQLEAFWARYLEPRFRAGSHLTLVHGDAYFANFLCPRQRGSETYLLDWQSPSVDLNGYDLANLIATFWTSEERSESAREMRMLRQYLHTLQSNGVEDYTWEELVVDYQIGLLFWLFMPIQDRRDGSPKEYWWPKMQCLVSAYRDWRCEELLGIKLG